MGYRWAADASGGHDGTAEDAKWIEGIAEYREHRRQADVVIVDHRNWPAFEVFVDCATQWRVIRTFGPPVTQGLDYPSVLAVMQMRGVRKLGDTFARVRLFERGALAAMRGVPLEDLIWPEPTPPASSSLAMPTAPSKRRS